MAVWQDRAFEEWCSRLAATAPSEAAVLIQELEIGERVKWLRRLAAQDHPVALGVAGWLSRMDSRPWIAVPGDHWELVESGGAVLASYPEHLGPDPLAMCGLAALWAGDEAQRWDRVLSLLGAAVMLAAAEGRLSTPGLANRLQSFQHAYASCLDQWHFGEHWLEDRRPGGQDVSMDWPPLPDYAAYREQLAFGVVPHEAGGQGILSEVAVLVALREMDDGARPMMAGLAYKALEGLWMIQAWQKVR